MKNLKNLAILVLLCSTMALFQGCDRDKPEATVKQNGISLVTHRNAAGELVIDEEESVCFERRYKFSIEYVGPIGSKKDKKIEECDGLVGWLPDEFKEVSKYQELVRSKIEENQEELVSSGILEIEKMNEEMAK